MRPPVASQLAEEGATRATKSIEPDPLCLAASFYLGASATVVPPSLLPGGGCGTTSEGATSRSFLRYPNPRSKAGTTMTLPYLPHHLTVVMAPSSHVGTCLPLSADRVVFSHPSDNDEFAPSMPFLAGRAFHASQ